MKPLAPMEYRGFTSYDTGEVSKFQREMDEGGWECYGINASRTSTFVSMQYKRECLLDASGFTANEKFRKDEINALQLCVDFVDTGIWGDCTAYENVLYFMHNRGWITDDCKITEAGRVALASQEVPV